jgi:hypothetical protein
VTQAEKPCRRARALRSVTRDPVEAADVAGGERVAKPLLGGIPEVAAAMSVKELRPPAVNRGPDQKWLDAVEVNDLVALERLRRRASAD